MLFEVLCIAVYIILIAPVRIRVDGWISGSAQLDLWTRVWGLPWGMSLHIGDARAGRLLLLALNDGTPVAGDALQRVLSNIGAVLRGDMARRYLKRHVHIHQMDGMVRICLHDAAKTAVLTGIVGWLARAAYAWSKGRARIAIMPGFAEEHFSAEARCIVSFRLGHMIPVLTAMLASWLMERREHGVKELSGEA